MLPENVLPLKVLNKEQKRFVKLKLLEITQILRKWKKIISLDQNKKVKLSEIRSIILNGTCNDRYPSILDDQKKLVSFINDHVEFIGGTLEHTILCSFSAACIKFSVKRSRMLSAELDLNFDSILEDLLQESYASVHHSIYYFTLNKGSNELSTYVIGSLKRSLERFIRYNYSKLSPMSAKDCIDCYKCRSIMSEQPGISIEEISKISSLDESRVQEILSSMSSIVRVFVSKRDGTYKSVVSHIPDRSSNLEDLDNIETVELLKNLFDDIDEGILSLTKEEADVFRAAFTSNFERGWQSSFARTYINQNTGKPYSRARIGQIYSDVVFKIKSYISKAA